jgi:hypothetical protein
MAADNAPELKMDPANLYREEIFTDRKVGTIRVMTPVKTDSSFDAARKVIYVGETQLMTPVGPATGFRNEADSWARPPGNSPSPTSPWSARCGNSGTAAPVQFLHRHPRRHARRRARRHGWRRRLPRRRQDQVTLTRDPPNHVAAADMISAGR